MGLTREEMDQKMDEHFGFEARDDVEGVLSTLASDAIHDIVGWPSGPTEGREGARGFYETLFSDLSDGKVTCERRLYGDGFLIDVSLWEGKAPSLPSVGPLGQPTMSWIASLEGEFCQSLSRKPE